MLRIKSAQYMNMQMPPKALPEALPMDDGLNELCKLCQESPADVGEDFCQGCLSSLRKCIKCPKITTENDGSETNDGFVCQECAEDFYSGGDYMGPRQDYTSRIEGY